MGHSKDLFALMRMEQLEAEFPTKKQIQSTSTLMVAKVLEDGNHNPVELFAQAVRVSEALTVITDKLKQSLPNETFEAFGLKGVYVNGRAMLQFAEDDVWVELNEKIKERQELLKVAAKSNSDIFDENGISLPKISTKYSKDSLNITF